VRIWGLQRDYSVEQIEQAIRQALAQGGVHFEGLRLRLRRAQATDMPPAPLDLSQRPMLATVAQAPRDLRPCNVLPGGGTAG
jgi:hypothetical protein